jgi:hypothetical protein
MKRKVLKDLSRELVEQLKDKCLQFERDNQGTRTIMESVSIQIQNFRMPQIIRAPKEKEKTSVNTKE